MFCKLDRIIEEGESSEYLRAYNLCIKDIDDNYKGNIEKINNSFDQEQEKCFKKFPLDKRFIDIDQIDDKTIRRYYDR